MGIHEIIKNSVLELYNGEIDLKKIILVVGATAVLAVYLFAVYQIVTRKTFYSRNFNISLVALAVITAGIILTIQTSIVVSLGMVGALSIVRFRTAVKEPMDLIFLFWAISIGIICGAGLFEVAVIISFAVTILIFMLDQVPVSRAPLILIVNADKFECKESVDGVLKETCRWFRIKSRNVSENQTDMVYEIRTAKEDECLKAVREIKGIRSVSMIDHDGETTF
jgi:hypothetical protein